MAEDKAGSYESCATILYSVSRPSSLQKISSENERGDIGKILIMEYTKHFQQMLEERKIYPAWVEHTLKTPDRTEIHEDGTCHFIKQIREYENRWLRIVVNICVNPNRAVTAFFDRRLRRTKV